MTVSKTSKRYAGEAKKLQENKERATKHDLRQFRYLFFIDKRCEKNCMLKQKPFLKHYNGD